MLNSREYKPLNINTKQKVYNNGANVIHSGIKNVV